ncbi:adenylate/guanylate cyclase domain-containing protein [Dongia deserti]|uniref:adenylate/guanylate cyclase domain-containing protein n=1 Tax=Dongia deserti TaxID=2268030 RepID=UPI0013C52F52|nr:adenylate/guanylate cyclase domain-containing protein [Dongia deserti]
MERRLAAILAADVVGYTRLMEIDEAGTLDVLTARWRNILSPLLAEHHGRIVKLMGDGVLVEFASAVNAVRCAVDLQKRMEEANAGLAEDRKILLRVGINLGDVIVEGDDLYGECVNIAARLESIASAGGIWLSETVVDHVRNKIEVEFEDLGRQSVKNIAQPIRICRVSGIGAHEGNPVMAMAGSDEFHAKPSIAVLPFVNLSGDSEQRYFSDGIAVDIVAGLSRFRQLLVIAHHSSFQFRDKEVDLRRVGHDLGVRYVVVGSVRTAGTRLRVAVQLIEAATGNHIWVERYDRELEDVFAVQDEITRAVVASIAGRIEDSDRRRALRKSVASLTAYDLVLRGKDRLEQGAQEDVLEARALFRRCREMEPDCAEAYICLAETYFYEAISNWTADSAAAAAQLFELTQEAARLDDQDSRVHLGLAWAHWWINGNYEIAEAQIDEAIALNPNALDNYCFKGWLSTCAGKLEQGIWCSSEAVRRAPNLPDHCLTTRVIAEYLLGRYDQAIATFGRMLHPPAPMFAWVAASYANLDRAIDAHAALAAFRARLQAEEAGPPADDAEGWRLYWSKCFPAKEPASLERLYTGLRKAGLPI